MPLLMKSGAEHSIRWAQWFTVVRPGGSVYITPEKIGYVPCFCDGCGDTQVWVATNIVYAQIAHDSQGVASLGLEKLYPVLPSETSIYFCYDFYSLMVMLMFLVCYIILRAFGFQVPDIDFF